MENKSTSVKREILKSLIERHGNKSKKVVVALAKEKGVYKMHDDDNEVYELIGKFAEFHNLPFGYTPKENKEEIPNEEIIINEIIEKKNEIDFFYESLIKERDSLSKKLLGLNKLIDIYEKNGNNRNYKGN